MRVLFTCTLFLSAALLFVVQPLVARLVLPLLGGTPAVWNTCMVFFQAALLAGYAYAHAAPAWLGTRRHAAWHLLVLLAPLAVLPLGVPPWWPAPDSERPTVWLLGLLAVAVGLPFFAVATSAPLLQRWFAATGDPAARDPYFLYAASNVGSLAGLFAYPFLLEPTLRLGEQGRLWAAGYAVLVVLTAACAVALGRSPPVPPGSRRPMRGEARPVTAARRTRWVLRAFAPSSLLLSVTTYLTTDIAAIPLLWVVPLAVYLLTFVLAFSRREWLSLTLLSRVLPGVVLAVVLVMLSEATQPLAVIVLLHLLLLFWVGAVCHGALAADRPAAEHLTEFYLWLSAGGVLGGAFNALAAPLLFPGVVEYPLVIVLACLLRPAAVDPKVSIPPWKPADVWLPAGLGVLTALLIVGAQRLGLPPGQAAVGVLFGVPLVLCYTFADRPVRFALGVGALLLAGTLYEGVTGRPLYRARSFFGVHRVTLDATRSFHVLLHGNTVHGVQSLDPGRAREPLTYYHRTGPAGRMFTALRDDPRLQRVGLVGLGAGALACYAAPGQRWTVFEIDPVVIAVARDSGFFTYLRDCPAEIDYVVGDARLTLAQDDDRFGVLVVDAFSSDAIPVHLLTVEAMKVYRARLRDDGLLAFHLSNRYLDLPPVLAGLAASAGMTALVCEDRSLSDAERAEGKSASVWVVMAPSADALAKVRRSGPWQELRAGRGTPVWTDDFSNLLSVLRWESAGD